MRRVGFMEYTISVLVMIDEVVEIIKESMEQHHNNPMNVWNPEDLEIPEEAPIDALVNLRRRFVLVASLVIILGLCIGLLGWHTLQANRYQRIVHQNATFITQQSARETTCFQHAQTAPQRDACAQAANATTANLQRQFSNVAIPSSQQAAANEMQTAYAALTAASCYDVVSHSVDDTCLGGMTSRLRVAILDANDAARN